MKEFAYIHEEGKLPPTLEKVPFLESFTEDQLNDILHSSCILDCDPGDKILEEGKSGSRIYILLSGEVNVFKGGEKIASFNNPGQIFGELAVVADEVRSASVIAASKTFCLAIDQKFIKEIKPMEDNSSFYAALYGFIAKIMAERLQSTSSRLATVEKELEELKKKHGVS